MKKLAFVILFLSAAAATTVAVLHFLPTVNLIPPVAKLEEKGVHNSVFNQNGINVWQDLIATYNLVFFDGTLNLLHQINPDKDLESVLETTQSKLVTNAGYYYIDKERFIHSGLLLVEGTQQTPLNIQNTSQISHVVYWKDNKLDVTPANQAQTLLSMWKLNKYNAFQTGPLLINNNQIQTNIISAANNAEIRSLRTVLGQLLSGERFIWIQKSPITLSELAANLTTHPSLSGKIHFAVNLDGGSSTSLALRDSKKFNFFTTKQLPNLLFVK